MSYKIINPSSQLGVSLSAGMQANRHTLEKTHPHVAAMVARHDLLQDGLLARDGNAWYGIIDRSAQVSTFLPLTDYQNIEAILQGIQSVFPQFETIFFLGTGIGEFYSSTLEFISRLQNVGRRRFVFIEPRAELFQAMLYFCNFTQLWKTDAVSFCVGPAWKEQLEILLLSKPVATSMLFAIHPIVVDRQVQSEIVLSLEHHTKKPVRIWQRINNNIKAAGPDGTAEYRKIFIKNYEALKTYKHLRYPNGDVGNLASEEIVFEMDHSGAISVLNEVHSKITLTYNDHERQNQLERLEQKFNVYSTYLILGSGDPELVKSILERTIFRGSWSEYEQVVYLLEPSIKLFVLLLHLVDLSDYVEKNRLRIFIGPNAVAEFLANVKQNKHARIPDQFFAPRYIKEGSLDTVNSFCKMFENELVAEGKELSASLGSHYDKLSPSYWQERFRDGSPLTIAGITTRMTSFLQYCVRDLLNGFNQHGHRTFLLIEPDGTSSLSPTEIMRQLHSIKPDLILMIDHLRYEFPWFPKKVPYICWIQDMLPAFSNYCGYALQRFDFTYILDKVWQDHLRYNPTFAGAELNELPIACNENVYQKVHDVEKIYDISYITHLMDPCKTFLPFVDGNDVEKYLDINEQQLISRRTVSIETLQKCYLHIGYELNRLSLFSLSEFISCKSAESKKRFLITLFQDNSIDAHQGVVEYLANGPSRFFCHILFLVKSIPIRALKTKGFRVVVWGNNWDAVDDFVSVSQGVAENGTNINIIQNQSRICLNNSGNISFHMRALEILASGNFMLSRRIPNDGVPITDYLREGEEIVLFDDEQDLLQKVDYYLSHEEEREKIAQKAMARTITQYSYFGTAGRLLKDIRNSFQQ